MPRGKVVKRFLCKLQNRKRYEVGDVYEGSEDRLKELEKLGHVELEKVKNDGTTRRRKTGAEDQ